MQPMGRPKHALKVPCFFPFYVLGGRGWGRFFSYFSASQCICTMFLQVPNGFPICSPISQCFPQHVLHTTSLLSHVPWKMLSFHLYRCAKGEEVYTSKYSLLFWSILGSLHSFIYLSDGPSNWHVTQKNKNNELGRHLI
jgi:hypothetical protein